MSTVDVELPAPPPIPRDRWGRPLVVPPGGGKAKPYTRCTTFVDCLDDKYALQQWQLRQVAVGLIDRPDLQLAVAAHRHDKRHLNKITDQALEAAKASAPATTGTALHALVEQIDRGQLLGTVPAPHVGDLTAYSQAMVGLRPVEIEQFGVLDDLQIGGTRDRILEYDGKFYVGDVKTGSVEYAGLKIAMQLAVYSRCIPYDHITATRLPTEYQVDTDIAIVIHLPAGQGRCELFQVDIAAGWEAVHCAAQVRRWRSRKDWFAPFRIDLGGTLAERIAKAPTVDQLRQLWTESIAAGTWTEDSLQLALQRKQELENA